MSDEKDDKSPKNITRREALKRGFKGMVQASAAVALGGTITKALASNTPSAPAKYYSYYSSYYYSYRPVYYSYSSFAYYYSYQSYYYSSYNSYSSYYYSYCIYYSSYSLACFPL